MLFTRCPDCDTTFRVTDDALTRANGQVRCGRCASVFNAYAERRDAPPELDDGQARADATEASVSGEPPAADAATTEAAIEAAAAPNVEAPADIAISHSDVPPSVAMSHNEAPPSVTTADAVQPLSPRTLRALGLDVTHPDETHPAGEPDWIAATDFVMNRDEAAAHGRAPDDADSISDSQVNSVLETDASGIRGWRLADETAQRRPRAGAWIAASAFAAVALAAQAVHHFRGDLATNESVGPVVQRAYELVGATVVPRWDVEQYEIVDWIASADLSARGAGSLRITARIKNRGPLRQPYPSVHLRLKDRWEEAVGSRVFTPAEYLAAAPSRLMAPGETTRAELAIVDPGQDAYGFELDVCVEIERRELSCGSDKVFR
jgi:predicted Zn finger-like uncharacterized protein